MLLACLLTGLAVSAFSWGAGAEGRVLVAGRASAAMQIDGQLDEPCWRTAAKATGFVELQSTRPARPQTTGQVVWDEEFLYVGVRAEEPRLDLLRAAAAQGPGTPGKRSGETVEIFLGASGNPDDFLQIMVHSDGSYQTWTTNAMQLRNLNLKSAVHLGTDSYSLELAIPFAALHLRPGSGQAWGINLCRTRVLEGGPDKLGPDAVYSSWQPTPGGFRQPKNFGELQIGLEQARYWLGVEPRFSGNQVRLAVTNHTGRPAELLLETDLGQGQPATQPLTLAAGQTQEMAVPGKTGQDVRLDVALQDRTTRQALYLGGTALKERGGAAPVAERPTGPSAQGYVVFTTSYLERGNQHTRPQAAEVNRPLELFAAPGEYEPATFSIRPDRDLKAVSVRLAGDLRGPAGSLIPRDRVTLRTVERMKHWLSAIEYELVECFLPRTGPRDLPANQTQRYWLTVQVPVDAAPGLYEGQVRIAPEGERPSLLGLRLEVAPIRLAPPEGMNNFMYFRLRDFPPELRTDEFYARCLEDMRDHGMTTTTLYAYPAGPGWVDLNRDSNDEWPMRRQIELMRATGLLAPWAQVPWLGAECYGPELWKLVQEAAHRESWPELLFYFVDEPCEGRYERVEACMARVAEFRRQHPALSFRTTTAGASDPRVSHYYDVWIGAAEEQIARAKAGGKVAWDYDCQLAPVDAHTDRYYFGLWAWKSGIAGVSHWAYYDAGIMNRFMVKEPWRNSPEALTEYTHRFNFVYPTPQELIPSIGWEAVREGIDDYRYLHTLKQTVAVARAAGAAAQLLQPATALLEEVNRRVRSESLREEHTRALAQGTNTRAFACRPPQPEWTPAEYDRLRRQVAGQVAVLNRAGYVYQPAWEPPSGRTSLPAGLSFPAAAAAPGSAKPAAEALWEACEDLEKQNTTYAQPYWRPKAFADLAIGQLTVSTDEKVEGRGSLRWVVTHADVDQRRQVTPNFNLVMINYLYGRDWSPYTELRFHLKCESPRHPPVYAMLIGAQAPHRLVLARDEVTQGWKEIRWNLAEADIGRSEKYGAIMNYFRLYSAAGDFRDKDALELYLDNLRLVTAPPAEATGPRP
jgi:hypothetical protein